VVVVLTGEQEGRPLELEPPGQARGVAFDLGGELRIGVVFEQLDGRQEIVRSALEVPPQRGIGPQGLSLSEEVRGAALIVPEARFACRRVQLG